MRRGGSARRAGRAAALRHGHRAGQPGHHRRFRALWADRRPRAGARRIPFTALDVSADQVDFVKRFGNKVYYGDASRLDLLRAAGADKAKLFVNAIDETDASLRTTATVREHFPHLRIFARARNRKHAYQLMDLGVTHLQRETFLSSLSLTHDILMELDHTHFEAERTIRRFQAEDERRLHEHYTHHNDLEKMQDLAKVATRELEEMFERDAAAQAEQRYREETG
jgi:hypothetical protein